MIFFEKEGKINDRVSDSHYFNNVLIHKSENEICKILILLKLSEEFVFRPFGSLILLIWQISFGETIIEILIQMKSI